MKEDFQDFWRFTNFSKSKYTYTYIHIIQKFEKKRKLFWLYLPVLVFEMMAQKKKNFLISRKVSTHCKLYTYFWLRVPAYSIVVQNYVLYYSKKLKRWFRRVTPGKTLIKIHLVSLGLERLLYFRKIDASCFDLRFNPPFVFDLQLLFNAAQPFFREFNPS